MLGLEICLGGRIIEGGGRGSSAPPPPPVPTLISQHVLLANEVFIATVHLCVQAVLAR